MLKKSLICIALVCVVLFSTACTQSDNSSSDSNNSAEQPLAISHDKLSPEALSMMKSYIVANKGAVVYIFAEWCPVCRQHGPIVKEVSEQLASEIKFNILNYEDVKDLARAIDLKGVPKMMLFDKEGNYVESINGKISKASLIDELNKIK